MKRLPKYQCHYEHACTKPKIGLQSTARAVPPKDSIELSDAPKSHEGFLSELQERYQTPLAMPELELILMSWRRPASSNLKPDFDPPATKESSAWEPHGATSANKDCPES